MELAALRAVKRSECYRRLRPELLSTHPADLMADEESGLTLVSFVLRQGGMAVFGVDSATAALVVVRVVEIGDEGAVAAVRTLHADEALAVAGR